MAAASRLPARKNKAHAPGRHRDKGPDPESKPARDRTACIETRYTNRPAKGTACEPPLPSRRIQTIPGNRAWPIHQPTRPANPEEDLTDRNAAWLTRRSRFSNHRISGSPLPVHRERGKIPTTFENHELVFGRREKIGAQKQHHPGDPCRGDAENRLTVDAITYSTSDS